MSVRPPSGTPPPASTTIDGQQIDLTLAASEVCRRYYERYPDEHERYGAAGAAWCRHDNQWLLSWAVDDVLSATSLDEQVSWLARVLHARGFPLCRLAENLRIAAGLVAEGSFGDASPVVAARLSLAAQTVTRLDLGEREGGPAGRVS